MSYRLRIVVLTLLFCSGVVVTVFAMFPSAGDGELVVQMFDVGQGDAVFIETPDGHQILIDGGPDDTVLTKLGRAMSPSDRTLDLLVLTHPHEDHVHGLVAVLERYRVATVLTTDVVHYSSTFTAFQSVMEKRAERVVEARSGQVFVFGDVVLTVLFPFEDLSGAEFDDVNDASVVVHLSYGTTSWLFTGDAEQSVEEALLAVGAIPDADVLKVGHHGSRTSSTVPFLEAISPQYALISAGADNSFGHPHGRTIHALERVGARVLRTDLRGDVILNSDGTTIRMEKNE